MHALRQQRDALKPGQGGAVGVRKASDFRRRPMPMAIVLIKLGGL